MFNTKRVQVRSLTSTASERGTSVIVTTLADGVTVKFKANVPHVNRVTLAKGMTSEGSMTYRVLATMPIFNTASENSYGRPNSDWIRLVALPLLRAVN